MNAPSPGIIIALFQPNEYYKSRDEYLFAIAEAMKTEYEGIVAAGLQLQIDAPDLAMGRHIMYRNEPDDVFVAAVDVHVEAINYALKNVPADKVRLHLCWGNYEGPHHCDIDLRKIIGGYLKAKPDILLFEASNPRHAHEWATWGETRIPDTKILVPGVIDSTSNYIEHPELVAERLGHFVDMVGGGAGLGGHRLRLRHLGRFRRHRSGYLLGQIPHHGGRSETRVQGGVDRYQTLSSNS